MCPHNSSLLVTLIRITDYIKSHLPRNPPRRSQLHYSVLSTTCKSTLLPDLHYVRWGIISSCRTLHIGSSEYLSLILHYTLQADHKQFLPFLFISCFDLGLVLIQIPWPLEPCFQCQFHLKAKSVSAWWFFFLIASKPLLFHKVHNELNERHFKYSGNCLWYRRHRLKYSRGCLQNLHSHFQNFDYFATSCILQILYF